MPTAAGMHITKRQIEIFYPDLSYTTYSRTVILLVTSTCTWGYVRYQWQGNKTTITNEDITVT